MQNQRRGSQSKMQNDLTRMTTANQSATQHVYIKFKQPIVIVQLWNPCKSMSCWKSDFSRVNSTEWRERVRATKSKNVCLYLCMHVRLCVCMSTSEAQRNGRNSLPASAQAGRISREGSRSLAVSVGRSDPTSSTSTFHKSNVCAFNMALLNFYEKPLFIKTTNKFCFSYCLFYCV